MSVADEALRRALGRFGSEGMAVYAPQVTTGQVARAQMMRELVAKPRALAGLTFDDSDYEVWYQASTSLTPAASTPAWTTSTNGTATGAIV